MTPVPVSIRRSTPADVEAIRRLAQLDGASLPGHDEYLLAEEDGTLRAALPLVGGAAIADPFHRTADLVAMLELRASRLAAARGAGPSRGTRALRPRSRRFALRLR